jgi:uncharacterized membrane protein
MTNSSLVLALAFGIGVVAGLRALTAPAVVSWIAHLRGFNLQGSYLSFMDSTAAVAVFTLLALVELVSDKLPKTPSRTTAVPLVARILTGGLAGATLCAAGGGSAAIGAILGVVGALVGTFGGYQARTRTVKALGVHDFVIALLEDAVAVFGGIFLATRL